MFAPPNASVLNINIWKEGGGGGVIETQNIYPFVLIKGAEDWKQPMAHIPPEYKSWNKLLQTNSVPRLWNRSFRNHIKEQIVQEQRIANSVLRWTQQPFKKFWPKPTNKE